MKSGPTMLKSLHFALTLGVLAWVVSALGCGGQQSEAAGSHGGANSLHIALPELSDQEAPAHHATPLIAIPAGIHRPLYPGKDEPKRFPVAAFQMEIQPVTNTQFRAFVWANPKWRRSQIPALFADASYLLHWDSDLSFDPQLADAPVTYVSWFAARAYANWIHRRLPTLAEWEYTASASDTAAFGRDEPGFAQRILDWYSRPTPALLPRSGSGPVNYFGLRDLHGLVWEWVDDFNNALVTGESRGDSGLDRNLFCGSGSIGAADPRDYAAFMRFATRSSLEASYSVRNLGFRCVADVPPRTTVPQPK